MGLNLLTRVLFLLITAQTFFKTGIASVPDVRGRREHYRLRRDTGLKPSFSEAPEDVTAMVQEYVELRCEVRGDPAPQVSWSREESALPLGRARILDNGNLKIG
ncbi:hemolin-like [Branchiostoma lanceolatum]|uniref:hemolin-like n=1 Tax=Branchiostoma lanceolatum TaxID=7740 RepID=UPI003452C93D